MYYLQHTEVCTAIAAAVIDLVPKSLPHSDSGVMAPITVPLEAPGIITQSYPLATIAAAEYPQQKLPCKWNLSFLCAKYIFRHRYKVILSASRKVTYFLFTMWKVSLFEMANEWGEHSYANLCVWNEGKKH